MFAHFVFTTPGPKEALRQRLTGCLAAHFVGYVLQRLNNLVVMSSSTVRFSLESGLSNLAVRVAVSTLSHLARIGLWREAGTGFIGALENTTYK